MKTVLVCNDIQETVRAKAASIGLRLLVKPMIQVAIDEKALPQILHTAKNSNAEAWAFSSKNAVKVIQLLQDDLQLKDRKIYAIGHKTAEGLQQYGALVHIPAQETATALAEMIVSHGIKSVLFWCGNLRREELPALLKEKNVAVTELVVYQTGLYPVRVTEHYDAVVFLSASAAESFFSVNELPKHVPVFAIGDTAAHALKRYVSRKIITPTRPDVDLLLQAIHDYFAVSAR